MAVNGDTFAVMPRIALRTIRKCDMRASRAILLFQKSNVAFAVPMLPKLAVDAVFAVLHAAAFGEDSVNIFL